MPFIPHTPEALIPRSDSKNPATTCKGITSNGRPCRRALGTSTQSSPKVNRASQDGVLALLTSSDTSEGDAAFFCWQHKEQASALAGVDGEARKSKLVPLKQRRSIDTLVERLGVLEVEDGEVSTRRKQVKPHGRSSRKETLPKNWQDLPGPLLAISEDGSPIRSRQRRAHDRRRPTKEPSLLALLCCGPADPEYSTPQRNHPHPRRTEYTKSETALIPTHLQSSAHTSTMHAYQPHSRNPSHQTSTARPLTVFTNPSSIHRPHLPHDRPSQTSALLSLIPKSLSPQITSLLLSELAKLTTPHDEEGFIYIFWLTPTTSTAPDDETASSLLSSPARPSARSRRPSEVVRDHASHRSPKPTILLKIGRASNVHRRMNEWTHQCNHHLSLIRFYPYLPSSSPPSSPSPSPCHSYNHPSHHPTTPTTLPSAPVAPGTPRKVPHARKVERLIHLELSEKRVKRSCETCGKEHREWFEVEGTREGVASVDGVVKRWVAWGEREG